MRRLRPTLCCAAVALAVASLPGMAHADAAGPGNFQSRVLSVEPATATIHVSVEGGDSFLLLRVDEGTRVEVPGYQDEPFLRFEADGTVLENTVSYTALVSGSRYVTATPTDTTGLEPVWHEVAGDGSYAWHDHRIHWMSPNDPPGRAPGDVILRAQIPLLVDGATVTVTVESVWVPEPSTATAWIGGLAGTGIAAAGLAFRRTRWAALLLVDLAILAVVVGWWQYRSLPPETGPRAVWYALPAIACAAAFAAAFVRGLTHRLAQLGATSLSLLAGVNLALWGWQRSDGLTAAVLPTNAPWWLDRAVSSAALVGGSVAAAGALVVLGAVIVAPQRLTSAS